MNRIIPLIAFSVLLLVPVGAQNVFATHPDLNCPPPGVLEFTLEAGFSQLFFNPYCFAGFKIPCPPGYSLDTITSIPGVGSIPNACTAAFTGAPVPDPTLAGQCQDKATLVGNHCVPDLNQVCGSGTTPNESTNECEADVTQAQLDAALAQRDAALADLNNLFTNNSCFPQAGTIQEVLDCITALITDLATAQGDLAAANTRIAELEAQLEEVGLPGPPVSNQGQGKGVPAQGKNKP